MRLLHKTVVDFLRRYGLRTEPSDLHETIWLGDRLWECRAKDRILTWTTVSDGLWLRRTNQWIDTPSGPVRPQQNIDGNKKWANIRDFVWRVTGEVYGNLVVTYFYHSKRRLMVPGWYTFGRTVKYFNLSSVEAQGCLGVLQGTVPIEAFFDYLTEQGYKLDPGWPTPASDVKVIVCKEE